MYTQTPKYQGLFLLKKKKKKTQPVQRTLHIMFTKYCSPFDLYRLMSVLRLSNNVNPWDPYQNSNNNEEVTLSDVAYIFKYQRDGSSRAAKLNQCCRDVFCTLPNKGCECVTIWFQRISETLQKFNSGFLWQEKTQRRGCQTWKAERILKSKKIKFWIL